jgi:hypothetical protein
MDPAIVSFRQFSQFNPQQQQQQAPPQQQPPQAQNQPPPPNSNDLFQMSQMNQQGKEDRFHLIAPSHHHTPTHALNHHSHTQTHT